MTKGVVLWVKYDLALAALLAVASIHQIKASNEKTEIRVWGHSLLLQFNR